MEVGGVDGKYKRLTGAGILERRVLDHSRDCGEREEEPDSRNLKENT